jgi:acetyl esterase
MSGRTLQPEDYRHRIDAETWAFIEETERWYPPDTATLGIAEQRAIYDRMCAAFVRAHPPGVTFADRLVGGVACRIYSPARDPVATVIYLHGGGFVVGGLASHDAICAEIAASTGFEVISADYRLSPEHLHPAAFEDTVTVVKAASRFARPLVLAGDSAGGNLAAAAAQALRGRDLGIIGQCLIYPGLGGDDGCGSYILHAAAPMLTRDDVLIYAGIRFPDGVAPQRADPTASPLTATDFSGLPPTLVLTAGCDPLADDGRVYVGRITAAKGRALLVEEAGLVHGYLRARHSVGRARASFARITTGIRRLGLGQWPPVA